MSQYVIAIMYISSALLSIFSSFYTNYNCILKALLFFSINFYFTLCCVFFHIFFSRAITVRTSKRGYLRSYIPYPRETYLYPFIQVILTKELRIIHTYWNPKVLCCCLIKLRMQVIFVSLNAPCFSYSI